MARPVRARQPAARPADLLQAPRRAQAWPDGGHAGTPEAGRARRDEARRTREPRAPSQRRAAAQARTPAPQADGRRLPGGHAHLHGERRHARRHVALRLSVDQLAPPVPEHDDHRGKPAGDGLAPRLGLGLIHFDSSNYFVLNGSAIGVKLVNGATAWTAQSDESLKENIKPLENVLDKIKDYRCVEYNLKAEKTDKKIGFIAQDWEQDFDAIVDKDADGILSMKYTETIPVLLKAIQELSAKLEALECQCEKK